MNPYANEDVMWERLKDMQREAENSRLIAQQVAPGFSRVIRLTIRAAWGAIHALGLAPRWWSASDHGLAQDDAKAGTNAA
jgi:hypothetical protein